MHEEKPRSVFDENARFLVEQIPPRFVKFLVSRRFLNRKSDVTTTLAVAELAQFVGRDLVFHWAPCVLFARLGHFLSFLPLRRCRPTSFYSCRLMARRDTKNKIEKIDKIRIN